MNAAQILSALRAHHKRAVIVGEVVIKDDYEMWMDGGKREPLTRRIDGLMFHSLERTAIEIKVSVADAKRETWRKVYPWKRVVHRFVYAVPAGLIERPPVAGCGLWWVHPNGRVEVKRRAVVNSTPEPLPQHVVQALAYRAAGRRY